MENVQILKVKEDILSRNGEEANRLRQRLLGDGVCLLNIMSSPGSGKTTLLVKLVNALKDEYRIGVIEADIDSAEDADTIRKETGAPVLQLHTGGACHLTGQMTSEAIDALGADGLDLIFLENVGNLVCPAEFDTGAAANIVLWSVPEGDDKPLKYPLMFEVADAVVITKTDALPAFDFSREAAQKAIRSRNGSAPIYYVSALEGAGVENVLDYVRGVIKKVRGAL